MNIQDLSKAEYVSYYQRYLDKLAPDVQLREGFELGMTRVMNFFERLPEDKLDYCYAPEKWSIKEILQHLIDTERIFMHRCFRIARHDSTPLAGFDQEIYIKPSGANSKSLASLLGEFKSVRENSISLLNSLTTQDLNFIGEANKGAMSARAAAFTILGHEIWHIDIIKERYL